MASTVHDLVAKLALHKGRWPDIAFHSGVPISTVRKIAQGRTKNPRVDTVDRIRTALKVLPPPAYTQDRPQ